MGNKEPFSGILTIRVGNTAYAIIPVYLFDGDEERVTFRVAQCVIFIF